MTSKRYWDRSFAAQRTLAQEDNQNVIGPDSSRRKECLLRRTIKVASAGEFAEEVGFVHAVLEGFAAVDEDDGDFVGEFSAELFVAVDVDVLPGEAAAAMQFGQGFFDDLAEVTSLAGVDDDLAEFGHCGEFSKGGWGFPEGVESASG
jgi:hypothetical protein